MAARDPAEALALWRYHLIAEALDPNLTGRERGLLVRRIAGEHEAPGGEIRSVSRNTADRWIRRYRSDGLAGPTGMACAPRCWSAACPRASPPTSRSASSRGGSGPERCSRSRSTRLLWGSCAWCALPDTVVQLIVHSGRTAILSGRLSHLGGTGLRILIVEDEPAIAEAVKTALAVDGHASDTVGDGREALEWTRSYDYDLVILDVLLPGLDGFSVCSALRARGLAAPVLMLTALDGVDDRVTGLDRGADDYLAKPFAMDELRARVRALGRRRVEERAPRIEVGDLQLDPSTLGVRRGLREVKLTAREFALLELLARHPGQIFARERLIEVLWDADFAAESNIVEVYIRSLRRKVDEGRRDGLIETVRGAGYRLRDEAP